MKKRVILMMIIILLGMFGFLTGNVLGKCSRPVRFDVNSDGIIGPGENKTVVGDDGFSVCDYNENPDSTLNVSNANNVYKTMFLTCNNTSWTKTECDSDSTCVYNNTTTICKHKTDINCLDIPGVIKIIVNERGCSSATEHGICTADGTFKYITSCENGEVCTSIDRLGLNNEKYKCEKNGCIKNGVTLAEGEYGCFINNDIFSTTTSLEKCLNGRLDVTKYCTVDESCLIFPNKLKGECHSNLASDMCTLTSDGDENIPDGLVNISLCYNDKAYKCEKVPTWSLIDNCGPDKKCYRDEKTAWIAVCLSSGEAGKLGLTITTTSSNAFWCEEGKTIDTAIGCLPITVNGLVEKLLPTIFGIAGGIAFLMMVYGFIMVSTSSGDEKKVVAAKQIITSAITGLLVAIFALFLYKLIAIDILHIPGVDFGRG